MRSLDNGAWFFFFIMEQINDLSCVLLSVRDDRMDEFLEIIRLLTEVYRRTEVFVEKNDAFVTEAMNFLNVDDDSKRSWHYDMSSSLYETLERGRYVRRVLWNYLAIRDNEDLSFLYVK